MAGAVLTSWENMDQEPADERVRSVGHGFVPTGTVDAVVLDAKGDVVRIETDQAAIGNRDRYACTAFGSGERLLGVDESILRCGLRKASKAALSKRLA